MIKEGKWFIKNGYKTVPSQIIMSGQLILLLESECAHLLRFSNTLFIHIEPQGKYKHILNTVNYTNLTLIIRNFLYFFLLRKK